LVWEGGRGVNFFKNHTTKKFKVKKLYNTYAFWLYENKIINQRYHYEFVVIILFLAPSNAEKVHNLQMQKKEVNNLGP
jgi:hypothetical protein